MPDISIIIPVYNSKKYIDRCVKSLIGQTKKELEFIFVDDGSSDDSVKIIKKYNDKRCKVYENAHNGIGKSRNFGIEQAKGKYIMFVDSDDYLELDACEKLFEKIEEEKADLVVCNFYRDEDGNKSKVIIPPFKSSSLKENNNLLLEINLGPCNKIYKTSLIKDNNIKFIENLKYEDVPFVIECLKYSKKISYLDDCLSNYVIHSNSETTVRDERVFDILKIIDIVRETLKKENYLKEELDTLTISILMNYNIQQRNQKDFKVGKNFIEESFSYLEKNIPNYKKNIYYKKRNRFKVIIEKNKWISISYCWLYRLFR